MSHSTDVRDKHNWNVTKTTPRTTNRTLNEDITSDHFHTENEGANNNNIGQNGNFLINTVADASVHDERDTAAVL